MIRKTKKVYVRWSLIYMIVPALILAIVVFCGIRFLQYEMKHELVQSHKATAELIDSEMEKFLITNDTTAKNISKNSQLGQLMQKTVYDLSFYNELQQFYSNISPAFSGEYISDYAIYIKNSKNLVHAASLFPAKSFFEDYCPGDIDDYNAWETLINEDHTFSMYRDKNGDILYLKSLYKNANSSAEKLGTLILKIPNIALKSEFAEGIKQGTANVFIKQQGRIIYSLYEDEVISADGLPVGKGSFSKGGVMYFNSKVGVLEVTYAVNEGDAFKSLLAYEKATALIAIFLLIIGAAFTIVLSKWQYKPLATIMKRIGGSYDYGGKNEFEYINASIDYYEKQQSANVEKLARYRETALSQMLARHITKNGCMNLQAVFEKCNYPLSGKYYAVVIVYIEAVNENLWSGSSGDYQLMHFAIENVCTELFNEEFSLLTLPINGEYYTGLVFSEKENNFSNRLKEIYDKVEEVLNELGVGIMVHIGAEFADIDNLRQAYNKVVTRIKKPDKEHSVDLVKVWEEASDTSDIKNAEKRVKEIIAYIKNNYGDCSLNMESIAHHIGLNSRYMLKVFKEQTGVLLKDYILKIRIDKAKELLQTTDMTIEAVARKCGYTSAHSFIRAFKRTCGMTPGELRQTDGKEETE